MYQAKPKTTEDYITTRDETTPNDIIGSREVLVEAESGLRQTSSPPDRAEEDEEDATVLYENGEFFQTARKGKSQKAKPRYAYSQVIKHPKRKEENVEEELRIENDDAPEVESKAIHEGKGKRRKKHAKHKIDSNNGREVTTGTKALRVEKPAGHAKVKDITVEMATAGDEEQDYENIEAPVVRTLNDDELYLDMSQRNNYPSDEETQHDYINCTDISIP